MLPASQFTMWNMATLVHAMLALATVAAEPSHSVFTTITDGESGEYDPSYPTNIHSERGLPECEPNAVCSALHKRFWFKIKLERLCRCPNRYECSREWSEDYKDNYTMMLNNRSQLKFCEKVTNLARCNHRQSAMTITTRSMEVPVSYNQTAMATLVSIVAFCHCHPHHYWKHRRPSNKNITTNVYRCAKLSKCNTNEFCGHIRADHFSSYYRCSCPRGNWCMFTEDRRLHTATELLYHGEAYKGHCYNYTPQTKRGRKHHST